MIGAPKRQTNGFRHLRYDNSTDLKKAMSMLSRLLVILAFVLMNILLNGVLPAGVIIGNLPGNDGSNELFNQTSSMS